MAEEFEEEGVLHHLPPEHQARLIRKGASLVAALLAEQYQIETADILQAVGDPVAKNLDPETYARRAEIAALHLSAEKSPLKGMGETEGEIISPILMAP